MPDTGPTPHGDSAAPLDPIESARTEAGRILAREAIDSMTAAGMRREDAEALVRQAQDLGRAIPPIRSSFPDCPSRQGGTARWAYGRVTFWGADEIHGTTRWRWWARIRAFSASGAGYGTPVVKRVQVPR